MRREDGSDDSAEVPDILEYEDLTLLRNLIERRLAEPFVTPEEIRATIRGMRAERLERAAGADTGETEA